LPPKVIDKKIAHWARILIFRCDATNVIEIVA